MMGGPPPDAQFLGITGAHGPADAAKIEAALRRCDPSLLFWSDWPRGRVAVSSRAPAQALCAAVQGAGYGVLVQKADGTPAGRGSVAGIIGRVLLYAVIGGVAGVLAGIGLGFANAMVNPDCTRPGSSGGCAIGVGLFGIFLGLAGVPAGAILGLIHGVIRRYG
jgi:hypothetical protein